MLNDNITPDSKNQSEPALKEESKGSEFPSQDTSSDENKVKDFVNKKEETPQSDEESKSGFIRFFSFVLFFSLSLIFILYGILIYLIYSKKLAGTIEIFKNFGINSVQEIQTAFSDFTVYFFGATSLILFLVALIKGFIWVLSSKENIGRKKRRNSFIKISIFFFLTLGVGLSLYSIIQQADVSEKGQQAQFIQTSPENILRLSGPVVIDFSINPLLIGQIKSSVSAVQSFLWKIQKNNQEPKEISRAEGMKYNFDEVGGYQVFFELSYKDPQGEIQVYKENTLVTISDIKVIANILQSKETGEVPLEVSFSGETSIDPDSNGKIIEYQWDTNGDGVFGDEVDPKTKKGLIRFTKTFKEPGNYKIALRVIGQNKDVDIEERVIKVLPAKQKIFAKIESEDDQYSGKAPFTVNFNAEKSFVREGYIKKYTWTVEGEVGQTEGTNFKKIFKVPGKYKIQLKVESEDGLRAVEEREILVYFNQFIDIQTDPISLNIDGSLQGEVPFEVQFNTEGSTIVNPVSWKWDFNNDGKPDNYKKDPVFIFREKGDFPVKLMIKNAKGKLFEKTILIRVTDTDLKAKITASKTAGVYPLEVQLDGTSSISKTSPIISYEWTIGDNIPISGEGLIKYRFNTVGIIPVKLKVITAKGKVDNSQILISVLEPTLEANIKATTTRGVAPLKVYFSPVGSKGQGIQKYEWDFGNGEKSFDLQTNYEYKTPGIYTVKLKVINNQGVFDDTELKITVD